MLCEHCNKKDATSIFLISQTGKLQYLCGACYRKINNEVELESLAIKETNNIKIEPKCPSCGTTYKEFNMSKMFGCEECYNAFEEFLKSSFLPLFKEQKYFGKKPNAYYVEKQIKELEQMVEICLKNNNFQKATQYGLEIKRLKEQNYDRF